MVGSLRAPKLVWAITLAAILAGVAIPLQGQREPLSLETTRRILAADKSTANLGSISLDGFEFSRELEVGNGVRVIAVTGAMKGGLAAFRKGGSLITTVSTGRITWLQLFDLNEDHLSEVITEEVNGRGTGILTKSFAVYVLSANAVKNVWRQDSYIRRAPWNPEESKPVIDETLSFLRFDSSGAGRKARMTYLTRGRPGAKLIERVFEMEGESVRERTP
jgi:hypothetical protein